MIYRFFFMLYTSNQIGYRETLYSVSRSRDKTETNRRITYRFEVNIDMKTNNLKRKIVSNREEYFVVFELWNRETQIKLHLRSYIPYQYNWKLFSILNYSFNIPLRKEMCWHFVRLILLIAHCKCIFIIHLLELDIEFLRLFSLFTFEYCGTFQFYL